MLCLFSQPVLINRLAALHRGTLRALRVIIHQLSDHGKVPSYHRELVHLIQQLSICSAQVKEEGSSALSESALQVIQKLEVGVLFTMGNLNDNVQLIWFSNFLCCYSL